MRLGHHSPKMGRRLPNFAKKQTGAAEQQKLYFKPPVLGSRVDPAEVVVVVVGVER